MSSTKGIILAGGTGTRLYPITLATNKQLLPVYDKPMIYYPLSTLMLGGIRDVLIITAPNDLSSYQSLLGDGSLLGCTFRYCVQEKPRGLPEAFILGEKFIDNSPVTLILGDNIFYGKGLGRELGASTNPSGANILAYRVDDPRPYGVLSLDKDDKVLDIQEKPTTPASNYIIPGLYFFDAEVVALSKSLSPSPRGELEITDLHRQYLNKGSLHVEFLGRGAAWIDAGNADSLLAASQFVHVIQERQGLKIGCIEEIAFRMGYIDKNQLQYHADKHAKSQYGQYLRDIIS